MWVTSEPFLAQQARTQLTQAVPNLATLEKSGQIEIVNYSDWYLRAGKQDADTVLQQWIDRQAAALEQGYSGLRLTGNTYWLERQDWKAFTEYEEKVNAAFRKHRIIGLCSYCMDRTNSHDVFDVIRNHDFALIRQHGNWELLETATVKTAKQELTKLNQELKVNLKHAKEAAESANRLKTAFLANMSHEIRTPLGSILGFTELLHDNDLSPTEREEFVKTIQRNGASLLSLLDDILDVSKIEADRLDIEKRAFSPFNLVSETISTFLPTIQSKSLTLKAEYDPDIPELVISDPARLRQILVNLVSNAIKFTKAGEVLICVELHCDGDGPQITFAVQDTGIGVSPGSVKAIFEPFRQADGSVTRRYGGTGLGLYLSQRLAEALGGYLSLKWSQPGKGSTFCLSIPAQVPLPHSPQQVTIKKQSERNTSLLKGLRVLVVDDIADNRVLLGYILKNYGAVAKFACDGRSAIPMVMHDDFDVVLMDLQMPGMDGYSALKELRRYNFTKPVIALTAHAMCQERQHSMEAGFVAHLSKPINRNELLRTLQRYVLGGSQSTNDAEYIDRLDN